MSGLPPLALLRQQLRKDLEYRQSAVFQTPPADWAQFQRALGEYIGVQSALTKVETLLRDRGELEGE